MPRCTRVALESEGSKEQMVRTTNTRRNQSAHPPWPLREAELLELDDSLIGAAGLTQPTDAPVSVLFSDGVPVRFGWPTAV